MCGLRPIPIEVHPASFAALPKLTLQAGLANVMPGAPTSFDEPEPMIVETPTGPKRGHKLTKTKGNGKWRDRKKLGLKIRTDGYVVTALY